MRVQKATVTFFLPKWTRGLKLPWEKILVVYSQWSSLHLPLFQHLRHPFFSNLGLGFSTPYPIPRALLSKLQSFPPINAISLQSIFPETSLQLPWWETMLPLRRLCQLTLVNTKLNICSPLPEILDFPMRLNAFSIIFRW